MRKSKKLLSILLAICMLLSAVPIMALTASAEGEEFYAVLNTAAEGEKIAGTLSLYYDTKKASHTESTKTVYDNLPTEAKAYSDWGYAASSTTRASVKNIVIDESVANYKGLKSTAYMFCDFSYVSNISGCEYLYVDNVTDMQQMFRSLGQDKSSTLNVVPNVKDWKTGNVTNMSQMFLRYAKLTTDLSAVPDVSKWDTSKVTNMSSLFASYGYGSEKLNDVPNVADWDTGNVTDMTSLFGSYGYYSTALSKVPDVSNWNTGKVTKANSSFNNYAYTSTEITAVPDVSEWNTEKFTDISSMFYQYAFNSKKTLEPLDLSKWSIKELTTSKITFTRYNGSNNTGNSPVIYGDEWSNQKDISSPSMFKGSTLKYASTAYTWAQANTSDTGCFTKGYHITNNTKEEAKATNGGYITVDKKITVENDTVTVTVTPNDGYELDKIYVNGTAIEGTTFTMPAEDVTVTATFKSNVTTYEVSCSECTNGSVSIGDITKYAEGEPVTITVIPVDGFELDKIYVNDEEITGTTFTMPAGAVTVRATFKKVASTSDPFKNATYTASIILKDSMDLKMKINNIPDVETDKLFIYVDDKEVDYTFDKENGIVSCILKSFNPNEIGTPVTIRVAYDNNDVKTINYSVKKYCDKVISLYGESENATYVAFVNLCKAVLDYGKYTAKYLKEDTSVFGDDFFNYEEMEISALEGTSSTATDAAASLSLGSKIALNFYVKGTVDESQVEVYNNLNERVLKENVSVSASDIAGYDYKITVKDISAVQMSRAYTLKIDGEPIITYGTYNYCSDAQTTFDDATLITLCKAVYNYGQTAKAYTDAAAKA